MQTSLSVLTNVTSQIRAPRKLKLLPASGQHKNIPCGAMAADYKSTGNAILSID
jgi:hypothetical protein